MNVTQKHTVSSGFRGTNGESFALEIWRARGSCAPLAIFHWEISFSQNKHKELHDRSVNIY